MSDKRRASIYTLRPDTPLELPTTETVLLASQRMADLRVHCVLVKDHGRLLGLFTSKDLAYRVTAQGLDPVITTVSDIMTRDPLCLHMDTPITEALEIMVGRAVRHLPLIDDDGDIKGVIDITRCFHQAMLRLERIAVDARKLGEVLKDVQENFEDIRSLEAERIVKDVKELGKLVDIPTLNSVVADGKPPVYIDSHADVYTAAVLMVKHATTALLVVDGTSESKKVIGIFTSKDIAFRVLARGLEPTSCTVARVLTSSPEFAKSSLTVSGALRLMYQGHFLNLPVVDDISGDIIGIVSVLQLTYTALAQLGRKEHFNEGSVQKSTLEEVATRLGKDNAPAWDTFWDSLEKSTDEMYTLESSVSRSPRVRSRAATPQSGSRRPSLNQVLMSSSLRSVPITSRRFSEGNETTSMSMSGSPSGSGGASGSVRYQRIPSAESLTRMSFYLKRKTILFKIKHEKMQRTHKISMTINSGVSVYDDIKLFELLKGEIADKLEIRDIDQEYGIFYYDEEGDIILIDDEDDLVEAINSFEKLHEFSSVELILKPKSKNCGLFASLWSMISTACEMVGWKLQKAGLVTGTLTVLGIGVLVGYTFSRV